MDPERRETLRRRYLSLGLGELGAATVFCAVAVFLSASRLSHEREVRALWSAIIPLLVVLLQAGFYWLLARGWVERAPMPTPLGVLFRVFRALDVGILALGLIGMLIWFPDNIVWGVVASAVWVFALVEYVNYFVVRLSYPVSRWSRLVRQWRRPRLLKDLDSSRHLRL